MATLFLPLITIHLNSHIFKSTKKMTTNDEKDVVSPNFALELTLHTNANFQELKEERSERSDRWTTTTGVSKTTALTNGAWWWKQSCFYTIFFLQEKKSCKGQEILSYAARQWGTWLSNLQLGGVRRMYVAIFWGILKESFWVSPFLFFA